MTNPFEEAGISKKTELGIRLNMGADALSNNPRAARDVISQTMTEAELFLREHDFAHEDTIQKAKAFDALELFMGHLQNGSQTNVSIWQDDAAQRDESVHLMIGRKTYWSSSLIGCIQKAAAAGEAQRD